MVSERIRFSWSSRPTRWTCLQWGDGDEGLLLAQDTSLSGQFVQPWEIRMMAPEAAVMEVSNIELPGSYGWGVCTICKTANRQSAPRWRGPAEILDNDETGATAEFQSWPLLVATCCVRNELGEKDASGADWNTEPGTRDLRGGSRMQDLETDLKLMGTSWEEGDIMEEPGKGLDIGLPGL